MNAMIDLLIEEQQAESDALDAALIAAESTGSLIRLHRETGVLDCGPVSEYRVWYAEDRGGRNLFGVAKTTTTYRDALYVVAEALQTGAGVVTVDYTDNREWHQEVWAQREAV